MQQRAMLLGLLLPVVSGQMMGTVNPTICDASVKQYAGFYQIGSSASKQFFYWAFTARKPSADTPTLLWMTGGPGCSSEVAIFNENGPCKVNAAGNDTTNNPFSWNEHANLIYIDQPAGIGFSKGLDIDTSTQTQVADDMFSFLQAFFADHPDWNKNFYVTGESYGGHYVPAVAHRVWKGGGAVRIDLKGLAIGNGLTDPALQYPQYPEMIYTYAKEALGKPLIGKVEYEAMKAVVPVCVAAIEACQVKGVGILACPAAVEACNFGEVIPYELTGKNTYDIRIPCDKPPLCYDMSNIRKYLNKKETQAALGVHKTWESCIPQIQLEFWDWMKDYATDIPDLLAAGIRVLIYAGDMDYVCNWLGNKAWTTALKWPGHDAFNAAADKNWTAAGKQAGWVRSAEGFTFLRVHNAGHMVPMDQPEAALAMIDSFASNKPW